MLADERILSRTALHFESFLRNLLCRRAGDLRPLDDRDWSERGGRGDRRGRHVRFLARRRDGGGRSRCDIVVVLRGGELWLPSTARLERDGLRSDLPRVWRWVAQGGRGLTGGGCERPCNGCDRARTG